MLSEVPRAENLWLISSGTGIGPFLSILKTETPWQRFRQVVLVHAVRRAEELIGEQVAVSLHIVVGRGRTRCDPEPEPGLRMARKRSSTARQCC